MQVEGSLLFTNNAGEGFKVFGQGTKFEGILGGKYETQIAKEAEDYEAALLAWASATPDGLLDELDARAAAKNPDVEDPTPPSTAPPEFPSPRALVSGCQFLSTLYVTLKVSTRSLNAFDSFVSFFEGHWACLTSPSKHVKIQDHAQVLSTITPFFIALQISAGSILFLSNLS